ncbi:MAG: GNAT family N-acetyltransferase [Mycobacteriales bacterium]
MPPDASHEIRRRGDTVELLVDGRVGSSAEVHDRGHDRAIVHTETADGFEGRGLAGELVTAMLGQIRTEGLGLVPVCPYVQSYLKKHPEYADLVPAGRREEFGLPHSA